MRSDQSTAVSIRMLLKFSSATAAPSAATTKVLSRNCGTYCRIPRRSVGLTARNLARLPPRKDRAGALWLTVGDRLDDAFEPAAEFRGEDPVAGRTDDDVAAPRQHRDEVHSRPNQPQDLDGGDGFPAVGALERGLDRVLGLERRGNGIGFGQVRHGLTSARLDPALR